MRTVKIDKSRQWTQEDYLQLGETNTPCQLINGKLVMSPAPSPIHQRVSRRLFKILDQACSSGGEVFYAPIDVIINQSNVFQPDLIYISEENNRYVSDRGVEGPPELVVEIISPSNIFSDWNTKKEKYLDFGVREYWIVDPANKTLEIYLHSQSDPHTPHLYIVSEGKVMSTVLTDLEFDIKTIF